MIASMTAFGRTEETGDFGHAIWEIRSVNHRYLEISLRLPDDLRLLETAVREHVSGRISRGKIDCLLRYEPGESTVSQISVNTALVKAILEAADTIWPDIPEPGSISALEILRWPGVINRGSPDPDVIAGPLLDLLDRTLDAVVESRRREGEKMKAIILERCEAAAGIVSAVKQRLPEIMAAMREKLDARARELSIELEPERLAQEVLLLSQKYDVSEELDRLGAHFTEVKRVLAGTGAVGRRLDFLMQEMNREANTLGSKASHYDFSNASVELKVLIEQMREQIQNIE